jgi:hypothetical protein
MEFYPEDLHPRRTYEEALALCKNLLRPDASVSSRIDPREARR